MKKALSIVIAMILAIGIVPNLFGQPVAKNAQAAANTPAIFIANRWAPVGAKWNGNQLVDERTRYFNGTGTAWGRTDYKMPGPGAYWDWPSVDPAIPFRFNMTPDEVINRGGGQLPIERTRQTYSVPMYWTEFYLTVIPDKGFSNEYEHWYAVVDDMGQLWFDPDGYFNDSRYFAPADPETEVYRVVTGGTGSDNCKNNVQMKVDPSTANNTQGPYQYMPTDIYGTFIRGTSPSNYEIFNSDSTTGGLYLSISRPGNANSQRVFQVGFIDMPDFALRRGASTTIPVAGVNRPNIPQIGTNLTDTQVGDTTVIVDTTVLPYTTRPIPDWDRDPVPVGLVRFLDGFFTNAPFPVPVPINGLAPAPPIGQNDYFRAGEITGQPAVFNYGEEWHSANVVVDPPPTQFTGTSMDIYDPGELIYRAGMNAQNVNPAYMGGPAPYTSRMVVGYDYYQQNDVNNYAFFGATRLTPVTYYYNGLFYNYAPGSIVRDRGPASAPGGARFGMYDVGDDVDLMDPVTLQSPHSLFRFPISPLNFSGSQANPGFIPGIINVSQYGIFHTDNYDYNPNARCIAGANIYDPYEGIYMKSNGTATVTSGDWRLTNVNGNMYPLEPWLASNGQVTPPATFFMKIGGMWFGDVLVLSELVTGGCAAPKYNLSVQTDLWEGMIPSETCAALRSPNKDFDRVAQNVQKNAVLDPTGLQFQYPSTVFQDMVFGYREFVGVEIFHDDNKDCNWGWQYPGPIPPGENLFMLNLADDYRMGHTGEAHIGMKDGYAAKDVGRMLSTFWPGPTYQPTTPGLVGPRFYDTQNFGGYGPGINNYYGVGEPIYWDSNANYEIDSGDLRMTDVIVQRGPAAFQEIVSYKKGSYVTAGDADVNMRPGVPPPGFPGDDLSDFKQIIINNQVVYWPCYYDERIEDVLNPGHFLPPNFVFDIDEDIYNASYTGFTQVVPGFQRLTDVTLGGSIYKAGSIVPDPDLWLYQMPLYGMTMGQNCDYNYADMMALPGTTGMQVLIDGSPMGRLQVEKTSEITISFDPALKEAYYDEFGIYHPEEVAYIVIRNLGLSAPNNNAKINEIYRVISGREPNAVFQFTPYRGTCPNSGNNNRLNYLEDVGEYRLRIWSFRDLGGVNDPAPRDRDYNDPWWMHRTHFARFGSYIDGTIGRSPRIARYGKRVYKPSPMPPLPYSLENGYDCFLENKYDIRPEQLDIEPSVACLQTLDQRFPNFSITLRDKDNKDDVNDPNGIRLSVPLTDETIVDPTFAREQYLIATYNGHGGGIDWIGTAIDDNPGQARRQYIVQVNQDGSYLYWYWLEPTNPGGNTRERPQIYGVVDANDVFLGADFTGVFNWRPGGGPYIPYDQRTCRTPVVVKDKATWLDTDCTASVIPGAGNYINCQSTTCLPEGQKGLGEVTGIHAMWNGANTMMGTPPARLSSDYYGNFNGIGPLNSQTTAAAWIAGYNPAWAGNANHPTPQLWTGPWATGYGVQTAITSYGQRDLNDPGGDAQIVILPRDGSSHLQLSVYTVNALFDYNSSITHPQEGGAFFVLDNIGSGMQTSINNQRAIRFTGSGKEGIDYCGIADIKVYQPDPYVNFAEWSIVDHALQYSQVNYTAGTTSNPGLSPLTIPTPQIQAAYNPILRTSKGEFRCYPGGQTHPGRVIGGTFGNSGGAFGWNAYPAIWKDKFYKLGTEFFPLTDYGIYFILKDGEGNHLSFDPCWPVDQRIKRIEISGPFARPREWDATTHTVLPKYKAWGLENVPIQYDWSGKLVIDQTNWTQFEYSGVDSNGNGLPLDFTRRSGLIGNVTLPPANTLLNFNGRLDYTMVGACSQPGNKDNLFVLDEFIPWNWGKILIFVTLWDGTFKMYQDCCVAPPVDGIDAMALQSSLVIEEDPERKTAMLQVKEENKNPTQTFNLTLLEHHIGDPKAEGEWKDAEGNEIAYCNDALVYCWQDRGIKHRGTASLLYGAGDGWVSQPPTSSRRTYLAPAYETYQDINEDGFIRFNDWETEIIGSYDMATNTWAAGIIDGRTFQRNNGLYTFKFSTSGERSSAYIDTVGLDFGGEVIFDKPDHIIAANEVLPVYITAYKYGDDNNDRAFSPFWDYEPQAQQNPTLYARYSHEVYLAGQMALNVEPDLDLTVIPSPEKLTAGVTPELVDVTKPLTFNITLGSDPKNLLDGIADEWGNAKVQEEDAWNNLFIDPHPDNTYFFGLGASLPQYYWLRTDLHNNDNSAVCNSQLYGIRNNPFSPPIVPFNPITIDFSGASAGRYIFRGFCANDNNQWMDKWDVPTVDPKYKEKEDAWRKMHGLYVRIYTPDRKHSGDVWLNVFSPNVEYKVVNTEDPNKAEYFTPGDPDFVMTAADNRIYKVQVTCRDAMGVLLKGVTKGVSVCGGGVKNTARFTPFSTRPKSFDFLIEECGKPPCCQPVELHVGFDFTPDERIRREDHELFTLSGFQMNRSASTTGCGGTTASNVMGFIRYNTTNKWYWGGPNPNTWDVTKEDGDEIIPWVNFDLPVTAFDTYGWGAGAIYNHSWYGGFLFANIYQQDGALNYHDALGLDVNAQTEFYLFAEDVTHIGGLVGDNVYCNTPANADLVGFPPYNDKSDPRYTEKRFRQSYTNDGVFYLDWDAPPDNVATIDSPRITLLQALDRQPLSREFFNANNYDLIYGIENHIIAVVRPADERDMGMKEDSRVWFGGNNHQRTIYGHTKRSVEDAKAVETTVTYTPTGRGEYVAEVTFMSPNKWYLKDPYQFTGPEWYSIRGGGIADRNRPAEEWNPWLLDAEKGLVLELYIDGQELFPKVPGKITAHVIEAGTKMSVQGAKVKLTGSGIEMEIITDAKGEAVFAVNPGETGIIKGVATHKEYLGSATQTVKVSADKLAPNLTIDQPKSPVNTKKITLTGTAEPGTTVTVNGKPVTVAADGKWKADVELIEGTNVINVIAKDAAGNTTSQTVTVVLDTTPPAILVEAPKPVLNQKTYELVGRVDPGSKVTVNGVEAKVVNDMFKVEVELKGPQTKTPVVIEATDMAGNKSSTNLEIINLGLKVVKLTIKQPVMLVDGVEQTIDAPAMLIGGSTMVPLRAIAQAFGAEVAYNSQTKTATVTYTSGGKTTVIDVQIKSKTAMVNGVPEQLTAAPELVGGRTMVPFRFIGEKLGATVGWDAQTQTVTLTLELWP